MDPIRIVLLKLI